MTNEEFLEDAKLTEAILETAHFAEVKDQIMNLIRSSFREGFYRGLEYGIQRKPEGQNN